VGAEERRLPAGWFAGSLPAKLGRSRSVTKSAIITGASSGIGRALALELARRGHRVALIARRRDLLDALTRDIEAAGGEALPIEVDVVDAGAVRRATTEATERFGPIDLAVANAGVSIPSHAASFVLADAEQTFRVNVLGMLYLFDAVIPAMVSRGAGRFAGVASLAGLRGLPGSAPYSASKAAMQTFLEGVRIDLAPYGVGVTTINPGFVDTPMTEKNRFHMPLLMDATKAARIIADGLENGERVIEFPGPMSMLTRFARLLPSAIYDRVVKTGPVRR
jgi:short-subunit dehydrogenase